MKTFVEKYIWCVDKTEIDLDYPFYEAIDGGEEVINEVMIPDHKLKFVEAPSMSIEDVRAILKDLEDRGANRVYIAQHVDRHGYYFHGVELKEV